MNELVTKNTDEIPLILLPIKPSDPMVDSAAWFTPVPYLHKLKSGLAITLDEVVWRDRFGNFWRCPKGFLTDGASVPWLLRWLWSPWDEKTLRAAIIHDLRYSLHDYFDIWINYDCQRNADLSLLDGMRLNCPSRAVTYFIAVRFVGRAVYEHIHKEEMMQEWLEILRTGDNTQLDKWINNVIELDKAA